MRPAERAKRRFNLFCRGVCLVGGGYLGALIFEAAPIVNLWWHVRPVYSQVTEGQVFVDRGSQSYFYKTWRSSVTIFEVYQVGGQINTRAFYLLDPSVLLYVGKAGREESKLWRHLFGGQ